jgi:hypothetical protein
MRQIPPVCRLALDGGKLGANLLIKTGGHVMPKLVKLYIKNVALGFAIAGVFVALLLWFNVMNLWHLVSTSDSGILAVGILWFMNGIVFAGVQFGYAVMSLAGKDDEPRGGMRITPDLQRDLVPVRVPAQRSNRQVRRR